MTIENVAYTTREDDKDLNELLNVMHNSHIIFKACSFEFCMTKSFNNCQFINCTFENVGDSTFNKCTFESPKFYEGFRGRFNDCTIDKYYGKVGESKNAKEF